MFVLCINGQSPQIIMTLLSLHLIFIIIFYNKLLLTAEITEKNSGLVGRSILILEENLG